MAAIRAAREVMNKRRIAAEQIVGPTLASARPGQAPALRAPFRLFSWRVASRRLMQSSLGITAFTNVFQHPARSRPVRTWALMVALCGLLFYLPPAQAQEGPQKNPYQSELSQLHAMFAQMLPDWKAHQDNLAHGEDPSLNDADWSRFRISEPWQNGPVWFRSWVEIPQSMGGYNIRGLRVRLDLRVSAEGSSQMRVFFNGALAEMADEDTAQPILLTEKAEPGRKVLVAINVPLLQVRYTSRTPSFWLTIRRAGPIQP